MHRSIRVPALVLAGLLSVLGVFLLLYIGHELVSLG